MGNIIKNLIGEFDIKIGPFILHNKEQLDGLKFPVICCHMKYDNGNGCKRIFCI